MFINIIVSITYFALILVLLFTDGKEQRFIAGSITILTIFLVASHLLEK